MALPHCAAPPPFILRRTRAWPSSIALASLILARPELVRGKRVADLGCGLGLAGMAAAFAGEGGTRDLDLDPDPELVRGKRVADLGCGLGLAGMAAAFAGEGSAGGDLNLDTCMDLGRYQPGEDGGSGSIRSGGGLEKGYLPVAQGSLGDRLCVQFLWGSKGVFLIVRYP